MSWNGNNSIFRTYLKGGGDDGKACVDSHKGKKNVRTFEEASKFDSFGAVLNEEFIDISFDNSEMSEQFIHMAEENSWRCLVLMNKENGHIHTYWKKSEKFKFRNGKDKKLCVGLVADIHFGETYIPLKVLGNERFPPEYDILPGEEYQEVPEELYTVNTNCSLWGLKSGDGRNDEIFKYILSLQSGLGFSKDVIRRILINTNNFIFQEPLDDRELEVILRDEAFPVDTFFKGSKFLHNNFAVFLKNNEHIKRVNGTLAIYRDGVYVSGKRQIESKMISYIPVLKESQRSEVLKYLEILCAENNDTESENLIAFENGILDIETGNILTYSPDIIITNKIPWNYEIDAYDELADKTLTKISCEDESIRSLLEEAIGYCFYRRNELSKSFFLTGDGANGKSTYLDILKAILGKQNTSALDLNELDERFSTATMMGKLANIGDDIADDFLQGKAVANLKKIVSGNEIKAEFKGQDAFFFEPYIKIFMSANTLPRTKSSGFEALKRRLVIIPFNAKFDKSDPDYDPYIISKLRKREAIEYIIKLGVDGLKRILENKGFTQSRRVEREIKKYEIENNPILLFLEEHDETELINRECKEVHRQYKVFCAENGFMELTLANFSKELNKRLGISTKRVRVEGTQISYYVKGTK